MATIGYARVSSVGQDLGVQLEKLADCEGLQGEAFGRRRWQMRAAGTSVPEIMRQMKLSKTAIYGALALDTRELPFCCTFPPDRGAG